MDMSGPVAIFLFFLLLLVDMFFYGFDAAIDKLRSEYPLDLLLKLRKMILSVFYYHLKYLKQTINIP